MTDAEGVRVLRRSPGRLRLHAPRLSDAGVSQITSADGVRDVRLSPRTANVLIEFDEALIDEPELLALVASGPGSGHRRRRSRPSDSLAPAQAGWLRAERSETLRSRPTECIATLLNFERYPEWQTYVGAVSVRERDARGRGVCVLTRARVAERELEFTTSYRFPSPNRIVFVQDDAELGAVRGSWAFRSVSGGRTRATIVLEVRPSRRIGLLLRGGIYERLREAVLSHLIDELRARVQDPAAEGRVSEADFG